MPNKLIGRVVATEKTPTTMDKFTFWTNSDLKLQAFDIVKVKHIDNSYYGCAKFPYKFYFKRFRRCCC